MKRTLRFLGAFIALMLTPLAMSAGEGAIRRSPKAVPNEYIVVLNDSTPRDEIHGIVQGLARAHGGSVKRVWQDALKGFFVVMTPGQAQGLSHNPQVKYIEENAEMFLSTRVNTSIDPSCTPSPCTTTDNRQWHLDVLDQNGALRTSDYAYCSTGSNVYVYVIDTGVMRAHQEFANDSNRVLDGYNASGDGDYYPAYDPCHGFPTTDDYNYFQEIGFISHGTGVGSLVAGQNVGVARNAKIVPVKVARCGEYASKSVQRSTFYGLGAIVRANSTFYIARSAGTTAAAPPSSWSWPPNGCCTQDGGVSWEWLGAGGVGSPMTVQMTIEGLDWILRPVAQGGNPYPKSPAVVTLSTFRIVGTDGVSNIPSGSTLSLEDAIGNLLRYNSNHGITVVASANNQDANACDTSPGRMSRNNPNNPNEANHPYKVITAGGTMIRNNPDPNPNATGGSAVGQGEPAHDSSKPTVLARWRCHAGDSDTCVVGINNGAAAQPANIYAVPPPAVPDPATQPGNYAATTLGSNGGACVSLFAPAKNIPVATIITSNAYRDSRTTGGLASGTSWSAPIVAAMVARILENNSTYDIDQVHTALMAYTGSDLDPNELNPPNVSNTPNKVLHFTDVAITQQPGNTLAAASGPTTLTVSATGTAPLTYEWYQVNAQFDTNTYHRDPGAATLIAGATSSTLSVTPAGRTGYFARVRSSCGSADTNIAVIYPRPVAPTNVRALSSGGAVNVTWTASAGSEAYHLDRKVTGGSWQLKIASTTLAPWGGSAPTSLSDPTPPIPSDRIVVYRVRASTGDWEVPADQIAYSDPSNLDFALTGTFTDPSIATFSTAVKAAHVIELRNAVQAVADAGGLTGQYGYSAADLLESSLKPAGQIRGVLAADFTDMLTRLNGLRTNAAYGLGSISFQTQPASNLAISTSQIEDLRNALK